MPRPKSCRWVRFQPRSQFFKPRGIPLQFLEEVSLSIDEFEAIRLADFDGLYQEEASKKMRISRQTFGRILSEAHRKIGECLVLGKALRIEGGEYLLLTRKFQCTSCASVWDVPYGRPRSRRCPHCGDNNIQRSEGREGHGRRGFRRGRGNPWRSAPGGLRWASGSG